MRPQSYGGLRPTNVSAPWGSSSSRAAKSRGIAAAESEAVIGAVSQPTTNQQNLKRAQQKQAGQAPRSNRPPRTRPPPGDPDASPVDDGAGLSDPRPWACATIHRLDPAAGAPPHASPASRALPSVPPSASCSVSSIPLASTCCWSSVAPPDK